MLYTDLTKKAIQVAYQAHRNQKDSSGIPYVFHPYAVAEYVSQVSAEETVVCAALLHDVVEDTEMTMEQLEKEFPVEVTELLAYLTHPKDMDYFEYIRHMKENKNAVLIKKMDIRHNSDESRVTVGKDVTEETLVRWRKKYEKALSILEGETT